jgi:hypothetical protein
VSAAITENKFKERKSQLTLQLEELTDDSGLRSLEILYAYSTTWIAPCGH